MSSKIAFFLPKIFDFVLGKSSDGELCLLANHVTPTGQSAVPELGSPDSMAHVAKSKLPDIAKTKGWTSESDAAKTILGKG